MNIEEFAHHSSFFALHFAMRFENGLRQAVADDLLVLPVYVPTLVFAFARGLLIPVLPVFAGDLTDSYQVIGLILAAQALGTTLGDVPAGLLLGRWGKKTTMLVGITAAAVAMALLFFVAAIPLIFLCLFAMGVGNALYTVSRHAYLAETIATGQRGRAISVFGGVFRIGGFLGPAVGGVVAASLSLRATFLLFALACLIALVCVAFFLRRTGRLMVEAESSFASLGRTVRAHYGILSVAGAAQLFAQMVRAGRQVVVPLYAADVIGLDVAQIGYIVSVSSAVDMSLFYFAGFIMDRYGRKWSIVPSFVIQATGILLITLTGSYSALLLVGCLIGFGNGLSAGTMMTVGADLAPDGERGEFLGVWQLIGDAGFTGAPLIVGAVADALMLSSAVAVMAAAGYLAAGLFAFFVPETLRKS